MIEWNEMRYSRAFLIILLFYSNTYSIQGGTIHDGISVLPRSEPFTGSTLSFGLSE